MVLKASGIFKSYGALPILKGVDISIDRGEIVSIVGKSGSGKSTLLHILGTLDNADKGTLDIVDKRIALTGDKHLAAFRNRHIGFVFQFHHLLPEFTALENVCIPGYIARRNNAEVQQRATELLEYLGLAERLQHKPTELSGGEQQRVAVARALINQPDIIFADEPTGNLDSTNGRHILELLLQVKSARKVTLVMVTHDASVAAVADQRLVLRDGRAVDEVPAPSVVGVS